MDGLQSAAHQVHCLNPTKIKELVLDSVLAAVYWWPDLSENSINKMWALAMCHNAKGKCPNDLLG